MSSLLFTADKNTSESDPRSYEVTEVLKLPIKSGK